MECHCYRSGPLIGRQDSIRTALWRTILSANNPFWVEGRVSSDLCERPGNTSQVCPNGPFGHLRWICVRRLWKRCPGRRRWRSGISWTCQESLLEDSMQRELERPKMVKTSYRTSSLTRDPQNKEESTTMFFEEIQTGLVHQINN